MERISKENYYLNIAQTVLERATCLRRVFGAIIVKNDEIISTGYNGAPRGRRNCVDMGLCTREAMQVPRGERYELCRSVHAEANAIISAARRDMVGGTLYLVGRNAQTAQDQEEYNRTFDALSAKCGALKEKVSTLKAQLAAKAGRKRNLEAFMDKLREKDIPASFDEHTFAAVVDQVAVYPGEGKNAKKLAFRFRDGTEIAINL